MIPKIIHYCWLSDDPIPPNLQKYIDDWKIKLPEYKIIRWDFNMFPKGKSLWVDEAFEKRKYAFAADYIRLYALYTYGGIYLDSDVEVLKSFDSFLNYPDMICFENSKRKGLEMAVVGTAPKRTWIKECLDHYEGRHFILKNGLFDTKVLPEVIRDILHKNNWQLNLIESPDDPKRSNEEYVINILPFEYFSPKCFEDGQIYKTDQTIAIHHFAGSWYGKREKIYRFLCRCIGKENAKKIAEGIKKFLK